MSTSFEGEATGAGVVIIDCSQEDAFSEVASNLNPPFVLYGPLQRNPKNPYAGEITLIEVWFLAVSELKAASVVIEPYISTDWNSEYSSVYCRTFNDPPQKTQRLHFFGKPVDYSDLYEIPDEIKKSYLGYTIIRPLQAFRVGDTVLRSPCSVSGMKKDLVHCKQLFNVSLLGNQLHVLGMPFMQQDTTAGVCAEADLWMVARYFNKKGETGRYRPGKITEIANKTITTGPGRAGLHEMQMMDTLRHMDLNPVTFNPPSPQEARDFIYMCIESEMPVIVGIPGHVFVVIGHDYKEGFTFPKHANISQMGEAVESFILHDDARGPYIKSEHSTCIEKIDGRDVPLLTIGDQQIDLLTT